MEGDVQAPGPEYVGTYEAMLKPLLEIQGPFGTRQILEISGGEYRAPLSARAALSRGWASSTTCSGSRK
jgi:hypothetical protein